MLWIVGFLLFVMSLKKGFYRYQFRQFAWTHIGCLLIVGQSSVIGLNIYEGLVWFIVPCLMVISNDIFAYIFGFFWGKTKLIELSPKKTWEGFIGGFASSIVMAVVLSSVLIHIP
jgi:phosphatidate cytidylyltransferase